MPRDDKAMIKAMGECPCCKTYPSKDGCCVLVTCKTCGQSYRFELEKLADNAVKEVYEALSRQRMSVAYEVGVKDALGWVLGKQPQPLLDCAPPQIEEEAC